MTIFEKVHVNSMKSFSFIFVSLMLFHRGFAQDIVFPKDEKPLHLSGSNPVITERIPVYIPMQCPENMLYYPGPGDKSTWSCDCKYGYLYFPLNNSCHEAYKQGPCPMGNYVYLPFNEVVPMCVKNPCAKDGLVPYNGICHELGTVGGPCNDGILIVNSTTYQLDCDYPG